MKLPPESQDRPKWERNSLAAYCQREGITTEEVAAVEVHRQTIGSLYEHGDGEWLVWTPDIPTNARDQTISLATWVARRRAAWRILVIDPADADEWRVRIQRGDEAALVVLTVARESGDGDDDERYDARVTALITAMIARCNAEGLDPREAHHAHYPGGAR